MPSIIECKDAMPPTSNYVTDPPIAVLGIDAAWTANNPSGISLWRRDQSRWSCVRVSPSYAEFCGAENNEAEQLADVSEILITCSELLGTCKLIAVGVDMPIATDAITARRAADNAVSRQFGSRQCSTHSPTLSRPGAVSKVLSDAFLGKGYPPVFSADSCFPALIEVYPHVSLLAISRHGEPTERPYAENMRLPYKATKTRKYWPALPTAVDRRQRLMAVWRDILVRLAHYADISVFSLPEHIDELSFTALKPYEDQIDALVCAWTAAQFAEGKLTPLGDDTSAIWVPRELM